jgi:RHS repeat-associated protein
VVTDDSGKTVWRWISDAFGSTSPEEDPDGDGVETILNHRFPGQYHDVESGLHYNYFRYYEPETGRYITSDPIGLEGGLNTFAYVDSSPMRFFDVYGLAIYGELYGSKVLPHELNFDVMDWGMEFDYPIERNKLPGAGPRVAWFDLLVGGKVRFLVHCKETDDCGKLVNEGYLEKSVIIPKIVPYTHHQEVPLIKWIYSIPYNLLRIAMGVDPVLTTMAKANGIPIPTICEKSSKWMSSLPFSWSDSMPISP